MKARKRYMVRYMSNNTLRKEKRISSDVLNKRTKILRDTEEVSVMQDGNG